LENLERGSRETEVEDYFKSKIFAKPALQDIIKRNGKIQLAKHVIITRYRINV
jgi:hypothetical protein